ncbi:MAG: hypothetical protein U5R31_02760 [Acidimicrobiia bacterium]|nr:hypothetical protein [Acidimicrobiia bacterium]
MTAARHDDGATEADDPRPSETSVHGPAFWVAVVVGAAIMAWGVYLFLQSTPDTEVRVNWALWVVGADVVHDGLLAPLACLVGVAVARVVPPPWRAPLQAGLFTSAVVLFVAYAPLRGTAEPVGNPTIQPLDYGTATLTVLGVVWAGALVWAVVAWWRRREPDAS